MTSNHPLTPSPSPPYTPAPRHLLTFAVGLGLLAGLLEAAYLAYLRFWRHDLILLSQDVYWMAPLANALLLLPPGIAAYLLLRRWPDARLAAPLTFSLTFAGLTSPFLLFDPGSRWAALLLACTLSAIMARGVFTGAVSLQPLARRLLATTAVLFLLTLAAVRGALWLRERQALAALPPVATVSGLPAPNPLVLAVPALFLLLLAAPPIAPRRPAPAAAPIDDPPPSPTAADPARREFLVGAGAALASLGLARRAPWTAAPLLRQSAAGPPNVLLVVWDTVRAQNVSLHGYANDTTPNLRRLARQGTTFTNAIATAPYTGPSHASMFTGRFPHELSVTWDQPLDDTYPTLAERLAARGYLTAGFIANISYCTYEYGLNRGFAHYEDWPLSLGQVAVSSTLARTVINSDRLRNELNYHKLLSHKDAATITDDFLRWHGRQDGQRPFFAFLNYIDAHEPYLPPPPFDSRFGPRRSPDAQYFHLQQVASLRNPWNLSAADLAVEQGQYDGAIAYLDQQLDRLLQTLAARGALQNTLVIITADHGEELGERRLFGHGMSLYRQELHVPLLLLHPARVPAGETIATPVSLRDIAATALDLAGADPAALPGASLARHWSPAAPPLPPEVNPILSEVRFRAGSPDWYPISQGDMKSLVSNGLHYILNGSGAEELYAFDSDPLDMHNLAGQPAYAAALAEFRRQLAANT